jgi:beta-glucanase (GH16 family)
MGSWRVQGQRSKVEAMPEFQAGAEQAFSLNTNNTWNIGGQPGSYSMSNGEMSTPLWVDKVEGGTAFIRYQHQVGKTMAQEAIVLSLIPGGAQFNGLERISIVKEGMAQPRAKVTYQLNGSRMR